MTTTKVTISLPAELLSTVERARKVRHCTRSELFREALRHYLLPTYTPTAEEIEALQGARGEITRGGHVSIDEARRELGLTSKQKGPQGPS